MERIMTNEKNRSVHTLLAGFAHIFLFLMSGPHFLICAEYAEDERFFIGFIYGFIGGLGFWKSGYIEIQLGSILERFLPLCWIRKYATLSLPYFLLVIFIVFDVFVGNRYAIYLTAILLAASIIVLSPARYNFPVDSTSTAT